MGNESYWRDLWWVLFTYNNNRESNRASLTAYKYPPQVFHNLIPGLTNLSSTLDEATYSICTMFIQFPCSILMQNCVAKA